MISEIFVKVSAVILLVSVAVVLILGIGTLFKGGDTSKKYSNKLMQLKRELHYKCEIGEKGEWECNGANEYLNKVFDVLDEYWQ